MSWWERYWGIPENKQAQETLGHSAVSHCPACHWEGTVRVTTIHTVLCPKCDMPLRYVMGDTKQETQPDPCRQAHRTRAGIFCTLRKGHVGHHVDGTNNWSWPAETESIAMLRETPQAPAMRRCGKGNKFKTGVLCTKEKGHAEQQHLDHATGWVWIGDGPGHSLHPGINLMQNRKDPETPPGTDFNRVNWPQYQRRASDTDERPEVKPPAEPVEKGRKPVIVAKLSDGREIGLEFRHGLVHEAKSRVRPFTEAKLYLLEERPVEGKDPGVIELTKALLSVGYVRCHPNDMRLGKAGGRRAALRRALCDHDVLDGRCRKCGIDKRAISPLSVLFCKDDSTQIWKAYWRATASVKKQECGCVESVTVPGDVEIQLCAEHEETTT